MSKRLLAAGTLMTVLLGACAEMGETGDEREGEQVIDNLPEAPSILASNAFFYYDELEEAWDFYTRVLGLRTVADYGFAKILQVAQTSFLTLVDAERGMHSTSEPKSVTLAIVTEEVEGWWEYLNGQGVEMRAGLNYREGQPHDGFVAVDPEGYFLEFERFNPHPENELLVPRLAGTQALYPEGETAPGVTPDRPPDLGIQATVLWLYYENLDAVESFYQAALGSHLMVDQGWAKVYPASSTGYLGFVDGDRGLHQATETKAVTVSFFTSDVDAWFRRLQAWGGMEFRTPEITGEGEFVRTFVGYDNEGYFLEWDTFLDVELNEGLLPLLQEDPDDDVSTLDGIIRAYYEVVSRPAGVAADRARDEHLHYPSAVVSILGRGPDGAPALRTMSLGDYHDRSGGPGERGFFEWEIHRITQRFGDMANVWSTYAASDSPGGTVRTRGINNIQLFHDGERWWITGWIYDSEGPDDPLPPEYLSGAG
jgi:catechol 2,3-dioxygenase-like lactoylglutathione lyase family enzyme